MEFINNFKLHLRRLLFVLLTTVVLVFFSEKVFWYVQGFAIGELILFYALPTSVCLWALDHFRVHDLSGLILVSALFGFLVEGVLTPVIYEGGLLDPIMPAYFIAWHGLLSMVVGWYWIRKTLTRDKKLKLILGSAGIGLFWGLWSLTYRLPESRQEYQALVQAGENWIPGPWPAEDFLLYTLVFSLMLILSHSLLQRKIWQPSFLLRTWEKVLLFGLLVLIFVVQVGLVYPLAAIKIVALMLLVMVPLEINRRKSGDLPSLLAKLSDDISLVKIWALLLIPFFAVLVYGADRIFPIPEQLLRELYTLLPLLQALVGAATYLWAAGKQFIRPANIRE